MPEQTWACPNVACPGGACELEVVVPGASWRVWQAGLPSLVAADRPICPQCGAALHVLGAGRALPSPVGGLHA